MVPIGTEGTGWVTVARFMNGLEAHAAKSKLESEGIAAVLADEGIVSMNWLWSNAVGGVKVQVAPEDHARACEVLERDDGGEGLEEAALRELSGKVLPFPETNSASHCPACGSPRLRVSLMDFFTNIFARASALRERRRVRQQCRDCGVWRT